MMEIEYHVPGIHCSACESSIRASIEKIPGVLQVDVELNHKHVHVKYDESQTDVLAIKDGIERAGFDVG